MIEILKTHNNEKYVRIWWEIQKNTHWRPYSNGGGYRNHIMIN